MSDLSHPPRRRARSSRFAYSLLVMLLLASAVAMVGATMDVPNLAAREVATLTRAPLPTAVLPLSPTASATGSATASATATPSATATASPTATATATPLPPGRFFGNVAATAADCNRTVVTGTLHDGLTTLEGVRVRVWWPEAPADQLFSHPSGSNPTLGPGGYEVYLDIKPRAGWWLVAVVDEAGTPQGDAIVVETTETGCEDGSGRQQIRVDFQRGEGGIGVPGPTLTPVPTPTFTPSPTPQPTPDGVERALKVPILMYHYLSAPPPDADAVRRDLSVSPDLFRAQLITLREQGYSSITMAQLVYALQRGYPLPPKPIVLTFDDGYRDNYEQAFPILQQEGFVATFYVITDLVERQHPDYMTWAQLLEMQGAGMEIGSHTESHPSLPGMKYEDVWYELAGSRVLIEQRLGREVRSLCYPAGRFDPGVAHLAHEAGYWSAVTTKQGVTHTTDNLMTLRRIRVRGGWFPPKLMETIRYWMVEARSEP